MQFLHLQHLLLEYGPSRNRNGGGKNKTNSPAIWRVFTNNQHWLDSVCSSIFVTTFHMSIKHTLYHTLEFTWVCLTTPLTKKKKKQIPHSFPKWWMSHYWENRKSTTQLPQHWMQWMDSALLENQCDFNRFNPHIVGICPP